MQITMEALANALKPIEALGQAETTFDVNGLTFTMRVLSPEQELEVQRYSTESTQDKKDGEDSASDSEFFDRFRLAVISHAICAVDKLDLRNLQYIETGEKLDNGTPIKVPVATAIRSLITKQRWTSTIRLGMFHKYGELLKKVEKASEDAIHFEPSDVDAEIERLEARLTSLKAEKEARKNNVRTSAVSEMVSSLAAAEGSPQPKTPVEPETQDSRQPVIPTAAPPPPPVQTQAARVAPPVQPQAPQPRPAPMKAPQVEDSFIGLEDPEVSAETVAEMNRRMFLQRQAQGLPVTQAPPPPMQSGRRAPHLDALAANEAVLSPTAPPEESNVYRHPTEVLTKREPVNPGAVGVNTTRPDAGTQNPRFRGPTRR